MSETISFKKMMLFVISANVFEWYEYVVFAFLAKYMGVLFFNVDNEVESVFYTFSVLGVGYFARPLGAFYFGRLGDKEGVGNAAKKAMVIMALPAILTLFIPEYANVGVLSALLFVTLRMIQGFAAGAELPLMAVQAYALSAAENKRLSCALVNASSLLGVLLASLIVCLLGNVFSDQEILAGAWRYPFIVAMPLMIIVFWFRVCILSCDPVRKEQSIMKALGVKKNRFAIIESFFVIAALQVSFYIIYVWYSDYLKLYLGVSDVIASYIRFFSLGFLFLSVICFGFLLHRYNSENIVNAALLLLVFLVPAGFYIVSIERSNTSIFLCVSIFSIVIGYFDAVAFSYLSELFDDSIRSTGVCCSFTLASVFVGGLSPVLAMKLIDITGDYMIPGYLVSVINLLAFIAIFSMKRKLLCHQGHRSEEMKG